MRKSAFVIIAVALMVGGCLFVINTSEDTSAYSAGGSGTQASPYTSWSGNAYECIAYLNDKYVQQGASITISAYDGGDYEIVVHSVSGGGGLYKSGARTVKLQ